jgi:YVTN family beta-propeller protein
VGVLILATLLEIGCGDVYRPTIVPEPVSPPDPQNFHAAFTSASNGHVNPGGAVQIDVSGDSNSGEASVGLSPVHLATQASSTLATRVWTANRDSDSVSSFFAATGASGSTVGIPTTINLVPGSRPVFVHSTEPTSMYVANVGDGVNPGSINAISASTLAVTATIPVGVYPWAMAETPDTHKLYVVNRDSNNLTSINTVDRSTAATIAVGASPQWAMSRVDSRRVYVLALDGSLSTIDSEYTSGTLDKVLSVIQVGGGASSFYYDSRLNRLYIPQPKTSSVAIYDATPDPPNLLATLPITGNPIGATALQDGTRAYVASYSIDANSANCTATQVVGQPLQPCVNLLVTVIDENSNTIRKVIQVPEFAEGSPITSTVSCTDPTEVRFRFFIASSADSSKVFISSCDAGGVEIVKTSNDSFVLSMPQPVSVLSPVQFNPNAPTVAFPPPQPPLFVIAGP